MGKGAPLRWLENKALAHHLRGRGIEIGALWRRFPVPHHARVYYVDRTTEENLQQHYREVSAPLIMPDVVADAMQLPFPAASLDFIVASHVLEHMPFPLAALRHWYDTLRRDGILLLKIPDKRFSFDVKRERTALQHLVAEEAERNSFNKRAHFEDWVENVVGCERGSAEFDRQLTHLLECDYSIHYHAWIDDDIREIADYTRTAMKLAWKPLIFWNAHFYRKECVLALRREQ